jgi:hypothetical protein
MEFSSFSFSFELLFIFDFLLCLTFFSGGGYLRFCITEA